ncbi:hypothetical protein M0657_007160 [Pyricularia oryzae]|nr:hypothetical protein M0657_007160 [Pyricularia oryzae]KAI7927045.1 hypothetical protein M9X92_002377 [Pyricularia oryzae]
MFHGSSQYTAQPLLYTKSSQRLSVIDTRVENTPGLCRLPPAGSRSIAALVTSVIIVLESGSQPSQPHQAILGPITSFPWYLYAYILTAGRSDPVKRGTTSLGNMTKATSLPPHRAQTTKQSTKWSQNLVQQESYILISDSVLPDGEPTARSQTVHNHLIITGASEKKNTKSWKLNLQ